MSSIQEFDFSVDLLKSLLWQHDQLPKLKSLIESKQAWFDEQQTDFWSSWFRDVFNVDTANDFGLAVWSIILDISFLISSGADTKTPWGFGVDLSNFENGNFGRTRQGVQLTVEQKRIIIKLRYLQLTTNHTITSINTGLATIFGSLGTVFVQYNGDMTLTYTFQATISSQLAQVFESYDILPRPAGMSYNLLVAIPASWLQEIDGVWTVLFTGNLNLDTDVIFL